MNYTEDQKLKAYAPYIGCDSTINGKAIKPLPKNHIPIAISLGWKPILKPLASITEEHACEVAKILHDDQVEWEVTSRASDHITLYSEESGALDIDFDDYAIICRGSSGALLYPYSDVRAWDFLRSRGYDLPSYHLEGKTLIEAGLAIDATVNEKEGTK